jgi:hypothetical protein
MSTPHDDLPARLVHIAALQLGDRELAQRWSEEWRSSLPPRDRYRRWRYALSILVRGAYGTRWAIRHPRSDSNLVGASAILQVLSWLLVVSGGILFVVTASSFGSTAVWTLGVGHTWPYLASSWCAAIMALLILSILHRRARWVLAIGTLGSLVETWTGVQVLQSQGPPVTWFSLGINMSGFPGLWYPAQQAVCLGATLGGLTILVSRMTPPRARACAGIVTCALAQGGSYANVVGIGVTDTFQRLSSLEGLWWSLCQRLVPHNSSPILISEHGHIGLNLSRTAAGLMWSIQGPVVAILLAMASWLICTAIWMVRASISRQNRGGVVRP